jgi:hypothetical protein
VSSVSFSSAILHLIAFVVILYVLIGPFSNVLSLAFF